MSWPSRSRAIISRTDSMCRHSVGARSTPALFVGHQACPTGAKQRTVVKRGAGWAQLKKIVVFFPAIAGTIGVPACWLPDTCWRSQMNKLAISLALGASAFLMSAASAAPLSPDVSVVPASNVQNVRIVCNENGRCWRERSERRVIIREPGDSYGYAPRERYIERRGYDEDRGPGIGFRAPGVSVGIGTDRY